MSEPGLRRLRHPRLSASTIGIVTFSLAQQTLIEDLLDKARAEAPGRYRLFGFQRVGRLVDERIRRGIETLVQSGRARLEEESVVLVE